MRIESEQPERVCWCSELELDPVTVDGSCDASLAGLLHTVEGKVAASGLRRLTDSPLHFAVEQVRIIGDFLCPQLP